MSEKLSKEELVELVNKICNPMLSVEEVSEYIEIFEDNVPHPAPSDLIFWNDEDLSSEEVVEISLAYNEEKWLYLDHVVEPWMPFTIQGFFFRVTTP